MSLKSLILDSDMFTHEYFMQDDVCRFCWCKNAHQEISPTATAGNSGEAKNQLIDKIRECLDIALTSENRPNRVCVSCLEKIEMFYDFKCFCKETARKLHDLFRKHEDKQSVEDELFYVKVEKVEDIPVISLSKTDSFDSFLESLQHSDASNCELSDISLKPKKGKLKNSYKPKRSPTYCNICRFDFKEREKFTLHNAESHGVEDGGSFKCFGCEKRFKSRKTRLSHELNFCKGLKDGYKCSLCDRCLPKRRMYEAHMRDHRDNVAIEMPEDIFKCKKCYKLFKTNENLKKHMVVHERDKKKYVCESCGRVFSRQDYLHKHKLTHSGVKQHVCPHCGFRATQRSSLTVHIRKHTGERPYSCDLCPQRCISSSNLRAHRRRHLGDKQHQCSICSKKFGYKISLEEHVAATHERSQSHPCLHCGAVYTRIRGLRRHLLAKHGKDAKVKTDSKSDQSDVYLKIVAETKEDMLENLTYQLKDGDEFVLKSQDQVFLLPTT